VRFELPVRAQVTLRVFDVRGRQVATLLETAPYQPGVHQLKVDLHTLPAGTYFYRLAAQTSQLVYRSTQKLVLLR